MGIVLIKAQSADCRKLYELQLQCFLALLNKYQDNEYSPGAEKIEKTKARLNDSNSDYYYIDLDGRHIGALRVVRNQDICRLKQIYILPSFQGKGYAQEAILLAEALYPGAARWELDTIKQEAKLCHLYEKMGYRRTGREEKLKEGMTLVYYAK